MNGTGRRGKIRQGNRELSWLLFNHRVQMEADNPRNPLLERAKFLAIVSSNLDEFLQVRYHRLRDAALGKKADAPGQSGMAPRALYRRINKEILHQQNMQYLLYEGIQSELYLHGVQMYPIFVLTDDMRERVKSIFYSALEAGLKPIDWQDADSPLQQKRLHLCVKLHPAQSHESRFVTLALPSGLPRLYELPDEGGAKRFIRMEDVVKECLPLLFPGEKVEQAAVFRVLRNQDFPPDTASGEDIAPAVRDMLRLRRTGSVMRLEAEERMSEEMLGRLMHRFEITAERRYRVTGPLDLNKLLMTLYGQLKRPELKYPPADPLPVPELMGEDVFARIAEQDHLLYHPYHSFAPVVHFLQQAAVDPDVCGVKMTLYRVSSNSPIVQALVDAAQNGKQVTVLFEAHARFDEENNLFWGERLRRAGCRVLYGLPGLKVHSKIALVTRMEEGGMRCYLHLGTGNYHDGTARLYTDMGLLTADQQLGEDACGFFAMLEGNENVLPMLELSKAPDQLKTKLLHLIEREKEHAFYGRTCGIVAKMNSLLDPAVIEALYSASCAGVRVELIVRGVCTLIPGVAGMSENIHVTSIVGRNLEHARAFRFENGGEPEIYLSSADWMPRNLRKRVELMFPVRDECCRKAVENVLRLQLADNQQAWELHEDGSWHRKNAGNESAVNAQERLIADVNAVFAGDEPRK
ncbi:MAG: polyphosphate kinase 1 [Eubacteriales bacterium]|nr:polyphosphate kinase 1 [Eubacteriales bacterium]